MDKKETQIPKQIQTQTLGQIQNTVPKFCTSIQVNVLDNGNVVLSMLYAEGGLPGQTPTAILIDRVIIDNKHAKSLAKTLSEALDAIPC